MSIMDDEEELDNRVADRAMLVDLKTTINEHIKLIDRMYGESYTPKSSTCRNRRGRIDHLLNSKHKNQHVRYQNIKFARIDGVIESLLESRYHTNIQEMMRFKARRSRAAYFQDYYRELLACALYFIDDSLSK